MNEHERCTHKMEMQQDPDVPVGGPEYELEENKTGRHEGEPRSRFMSSPAAAGRDSGTPGRRRQGMSKTRPLPRCSTSMKEDLPEAGVSDRGHGPEA